MASIKLRGGYFLPEGTTAADVLRRDEELLGPGLLESFQTEESDEETPQEEE
jgi:hypothetical protein